MIEVRVRHHFAGGADSAPFTLDVQFKTAAGVAVLFGPSGAGKTRTLDAIAGFIRPDAGRILVDDTLLYDGAAKVSLAPRVRRCGYVFQNYALFPHMTLRENLEFAGHHLSRLERRRQVGELLEQFHLADVAGRRPHELSGGQKQRCSIARALLAAPRVLLLDEPARGLDAALRGEFYAVLDEVRTRYRMPVLLVTHDLDECLELGDELIVMQAGRVVQAGEPFAVLDRPASVEVARLLGRANLLAAEVLALDPAQRTSRLRCTADGGETFDIPGPHLPGRLLGDRLTLAIRPEQLVARPRESSRPGVPLALERRAERSASVVLQFRGGLRVELPRAEHTQYGHNKEWVVEFPPEALRIF